MSDTQQFDRGQFVQVTGDADTVTRLIGRCGEVRDVFVSDTTPPHYFYDVKLAEEPEDTHWLFRQNSLRAISV